MTAWQPLQQGWSQQAARPPGVAASAAAAVASSSNPAAAVRADTWERGGSSVLSSSGGGGGTIPVVGRPAATSHRPAENWLAASCLPVGTCAGGAAVSSRARGSPAPCYVFQQVAFTPTFPAGTSHGLQQFDVAHLRAAVATLSADADATEERLRGLKARHHQLLSRVAFDEEVSTCGQPSSPTNATSSIHSTQDSSASLRPASSCDVVVALARGPAGARNELRHSCEDVEGEKGLETSTVPSASDGTDSPVQPACLFSAAAAAQELHCQPPRCMLTPRFRTTLQDGHSHAVSSNTTTQLHSAFSPRSRSDSGRGKPQKLVYKRSEAAKALKSSQDLLWVTAVVGDVKLPTSLKALTPRGGKVEDHDGGCSTAADPLAVGHLPGKEPGQSVLQAGCARLQPPPQQPRGGLQEGGTSCSWDVRRSKK
eukprot:TRINITY_DN38967_c0_g2_i1.p1 TRINITY_DN38967_c0_g2~~TRINITY_DN38967_c0_g2_i1.p1  ORF type:complete len:426 (+),score=66.52 TRINITY_DN38967_c0_g2_i1:63-1340(+)